MEALTKNPPAPELSEYELQRQDNIRRNAAMLRSLGLDKPAAKPRTRSRGQKRGGVATTAAALPLRRSSRRRQDPGAEEAKGEDEPPPATRERRPGPRRIAARAEVPAHARADPEYAMPATAEAFARELKVDVPAFVARWLGKGLPAFGKACVMAEAAPMEATPRFSKYSGVAEWVNCLFLFVNIGGGDYENQFLDGGRRMTWFGGSRMVPGNRVVDRLLGYGSEAATLRKEGTGTKGPGLVLLCRLPSEPYVCCGRLAYVEHAEDVRPLRFVWELLDADELQESPAFQDMLQA